MACYDSVSPLPLPEKAMSTTISLAIIAVPGKSAVIDPDQAVRLDGHVDADGKLTWAAPDGEWTVLHFVSIATGQQVMCPSRISKGLMADPLSARATRTHLNHVIDAITKGRKDLGSLRTLFLNSYEVMTPIDWTPGFATAFQQTYG